MLFLNGGLCQKFLLSALHFLIIINLSPVMQEKVELYERKLESPISTRKVFESYSVVLENSASCSILK